MCKFVREIPRFDCRKGIVTISDETGERAMSLGDFVAATKIANRLCRKWVAEMAQPRRIDAFKAVEGGEGRHP